MTWHVHGCVETLPGIASNNMGEGDGSNWTPMQKLIYNGLIYTRVSSGAIRKAHRNCVTEELPDLCNRHPDGDDKFKFDSEERVPGEEKFDDVVYGYMNAQAYKEEESEEEDPKDKNKKNSKKRGTCDKKKGILEIHDAVSIAPWLGDVSFNTATPGANSGSKNKGEFSDPFKRDIQYTPYQYGFSYTPQALPKHLKKYFHKPLEHIFTLNHVGGNHSRCPYDFSPRSIILRTTHVAAPRIFWGFGVTENGEIDASNILMQCQQGDIDPKELIIGGAFAMTETAKKLQQMGAFIPNPPGVKAAIDEAISRTKKQMGV